MPGQAKVIGVRVRENDAPDVARGHLQLSKCGVPRRQTRIIMQARIDHCPAIRFADQVALDVPQRKWDGHADLKDIW